ncbi:MAG: hypothetical protein KA198_01715 [Chitinophagaceae bacterium]|nr:hypothetical protein [Chitinophagaceae bacterium]
MEKQEIIQQQENMNAKNEESSNLSWYVFTGCMFIGIGIGMAFGQPGTGVLVGMGVGFIAYAILRYKKM